METESGDTTKAGVKAALITVSFVVGLLCFVFAAKLRFVDKVTHAQDVGFWVIGIVIHLFTGIAAVNAKRSMADWLRDHPRLLRFWTICSALGALLFGGALTAVSVFAWFAEDRPLRAGAIAVIMAFVGLGVVVWGIGLARLAFCSDEELLADDTPSLE
jgi:hypothetical protein